MNRILLSAALLLLVSACHPAQAEEHGKSAPAEVTVAAPIIAEVTDSADYVATTESPQRVEIRARVSGAIQRTAFTEGSLVQKGALLFVIDPRPFEVTLARAEAELLSVKADHALAVQNLTRADGLLESGVVAQQEWETRSAAVAQLAARIQGAEASVKAAKLDLDYAYVRSPIAGRVGRKLVSEGNLVGPATLSALTTVNSVDPLYVYFDVEETRAMQIPRDSQLTARIALGADPENAREAPIDFVDNHVEPGSGTVKFRAVLPNPSGVLADGLYARVQLPVGRAHPAVLVADQAIATDQDRRFVWVVDAAGKVGYRAVKLGAMHEGLRTVSEGIHEGDRVLVRGLQRPHAGDLVAAKVVSMRSLDSEIEKRTER